MMTEGRGVSSRHAAKGGQVSGHCQRGADGQKVAEEMAAADTAREYRPDPGHHHEDGNPGFPSLALAEKQVAEESRDQRRLRQE